MVEKNTKSTEMFIKILGQEIINKRGQMEIDEDKNLEDEQFDDEEELSDD